MNDHSVLYDLPGPRALRRERLGNVIGVLVIVALAAWVVIGLAAKGQFDAVRWEPFVTASAWVDYLLPGLWATVRASALAVVAAFVFGIVFGLGRLSDLRVVRWVSTLVVEFFRAVPVLVLMLFFYFLGSQSTIVAPTSAAFWGVVTALTLYNGSVVAELVRSGIHSLPSGQREAALAIGLTRSRSRLLIELPQALAAMTPALVSQLIVALKDTALGYIITYSELLAAGSLLGSAKANLIPSLIVVAALFVVINMGLSWLAGRAARRLTSRTSEEMTTVTGIAVASDAP
ncbi:MAG: amino acid ABC transporter permease [Actinomyces sp.]|uniref:amino acid ABC transporter permease n=1 Tax=Actinomyces sp. TaxID=29317 RepID=UPI0026DD88D2|nr:amino acid ABC transporter permease [Actinomyces sp.]MDO4242701.1 amino acid ABC transporter permease [Actinomyces sp.]